MNHGLKHASLSHAPADLINGEWAPLAGASPGAMLVRSTNPASPAQTVWMGHSRLEHVAAAVAAARSALPAWSRWGRENRFRVLRRFGELCKARAGAMADLICDETGKVMWEAKGEAAALPSKVDITLDTSPIGGLRRVEGYEFEIGPQKLARAWFRPHGVMGVFGPFNFPAHLPNGHIIPALAMGNTVVFKPSDKAPGVGQLLVELLDEALKAEGAPARGAGVINLVQGGADVAQSLSSHPGLDGILFTGSWPVGRRVLEANLDRPGRIVALELGGNNAAVVMDDADLRQAAIEIVRCAFNTTGQRCTCTRRVVVHERVAKRLVTLIAKCASSLIIAQPRAAHPVFMGPIITRASLESVLNFQAAAAKAGGEIVVQSAAMDMPGQGHFISPGVMRVARFSADAICPEDSAGCDVEVFGPMLRIAEVRDLDQAIEQASATSYGLAASIFTRSQGAAERFLHEARAGCVNINTGTAGASSKLPFGGLGSSGNHRPAGSFSLDYCVVPVAGMIEKGESAQIAEGMKFDDSW
jgi:succinylglutamic semialdehyde dehydrogenase